MLGKDKVGEEKRQSDKILDLASLEADRRAPAPYTQKKSIVPEAEISSLNVPYG